jgi:SAM-dependent methyltransferase
MARRAPASARGTAGRARLCWDQATDVWDDFQERGKDFSRDLVHGPALLRALGPLEGLRVLDLGCGQGRFTRLLARAGARVSAIDWSAPMIRAARRYESRDPVGIDYLRRDARSLGSLWKAGTFDLVVGCMSFMDMPDLDRVLRASWKLLRPRGRLVISASHPTNTAAVRWEHPGRSDRGAMLVDDYFDKRTGETRWKMRRLARPFTTVYWHRTLEGWFALLRQHGFQVELLTEPHPTAAQVRRRPALAGSRRLPFYLILGCRRVRPQGQ